MPHRTDNFIELCRAWETLTPFDRFRIRTIAWLARRGSRRLERVGGWLVLGALALGAYGENYVILLTTALLLCYWLIFTAPRHVG